MARFGVPIYGTAMLRAPARCRYGRSLIIPPTTVRNPTASEQMIAARRLALYVRAGYGPRRSDKLMRRRTRRIDLSRASVAETAFE